MSGIKSFSYVTRFMSLKEEERMELKRKLSQKMYSEYDMMKDPKFNTLKKKLIVFVENNTSFMVETYVMADGKELTVLRQTQGHQDGEEKETQLPKWIQVGEDVSGKFFSR